MGSIAAHPPGVFCWPELASNHRGRAIDFYSALFDWAPVDQADGQPYTIFQLGGLDVAAVHTMDPRESPQDPHWSSYVSVASADDAVSRARALGGRVISGPMDVVNFGRMATVEDPTGATIGLWESKSHIGAQVLNAPGSLCWTELTSGNIGAAEAFYVGLFEWRSRRRLKDTYVEFLRGNEPIAGLLPSRPAWRDMRPHWMPYFAVVDVDDVVDLARRYGGALLAAPASIPMAGRFAVLRDSQGAVFGVYGVNEAA